jgi:uncharacterized protein YacL
MHNDDPYSGGIMMTKRIMQALGAAASVASGVLTFKLGKPESFPTIVDNNMTMATWSVVIGVSVLIAPYIFIYGVSTIINQLRKANFGDIVAGVIGLIVGLIPVLLVTPALTQVQLFHLGQWLPILTAIVFGYIGMMVGVLRRDEAAKFVELFQRRRDREHVEHEDGDAAAEERHGRRGRKTIPVVVEKTIDQRVLLDTSTIIDGRIADISKTGFIMGTLVVPRFVLEELQRIADSADTLRRNRGRRGLDILNSLQKEPAVNVDIVDVDFDNVHEVDAKLVKLAKQYNTSPIITNDYNLNKVAELQGVKVLNINELANAVKPALLPGEDMDVKIIQEGKELGQGVGYLDDGTMIVVEGGKPFLNSEIEVTVTRVLQTAAGRMIFAHPKAMSGAMRRTS